MAAERIRNTERAFHMIRFPLELYGITGGSLRAGVTLPPK